MLVFLPLSLSLSLLHFIVMFLESHFFVADNLGEDCPVFEDMFEFCQIYAGATIGKEKKSIYVCFVTLEALRTLLLFFM